jgi:hypothetical protein
MLRQFAVLWIVAFAGLAVWHGIFHQERTAGLVLGALAATVGPMGLIAPSAIRPIFVGWTVLAFPIGWVVSRVVLLILFGVVVTPVALFFRLRGRDVLALARRPGATTYWVKKTPAPDVASYFRQS